MFFVRSHWEQDSAKGTVSQPSFPEDARWNAERQAVEFGVEIGEYQGWFGFRGVCSSGCSRSSPPRALRRSLLPPADPVRGHRRAEAAPAPVDRGRECGDQRARPALRADRRRSSGLPPNRRSRPFSVTQLRIRSGSSCPIRAIARDQSKVSRAVESHRWRAGFSSRSHRGTTCGWREDCDG